MEKYYIQAVDEFHETIYCHHDQMGESFIPEHHHKKGQFLVTEGGMVHVKTATCTYFLPARHYMWLPPGTPHSIHPSSPEVIMRNLYFPVLATDDSFYREEGVYPMNRLLVELLMHTQSWNGNIQPNTADFHVAMGLKYLLLEFKAHKMKLSLPTTQEPRLQKILHYIHEHLDDNLIVNQVAYDFGFSPKTLYRLFHQELNQSFIQYYTLARMLRAVELLITNRSAIGEIASAVGYNSVPTFSNTFLSVMGKRPSEYLKDL